MVSIKPCIECKNPTKYRFHPRFGYGHICRDCQERVTMQLIDQGADWAFLRGYNHLVNRGCTIRRPLLVDTVLGRINHR